MEFVEYLKDLIAQYQVIFVFAGTIAALTVASISIKKAIRESDRERTVHVVRDVLDVHCSASHEPIVKKIDEVKQELKREIELNSPNGELKKIIDMLGHIMPNS